MSKKLLHKMGIIIIILALSFSMVVAQEGESAKDGPRDLIIKDERVSDRNFLFAAANVAVDSNFDTTTFFAGNTINLDGYYKGDVFVAGNNVTIDGEITGNLFAIGNVLMLNGQVGQDVFVAGSDFTVGSAAEIKRDVFVTSAIASFGGKMGRNLRVGAGNMILNARVDGFIITDVDHLTINDNAEVLGSIDHRSSSQAIISDQAKIPEVDWEKEEISQKAEDVKTIGIGSFILSLIRKIVFMLIIWLFISFLSQEFNTNMTTIVKKHLWPSLGFGVAYLFLSPIIILLAFIIYLPLGIAITLLVSASFILAMPIAVVGFSKVVIPVFETKMKPRLASFSALLSTALALILIAFIPYLGGIASFFLVVFGTGMVSYNILLVRRLIKEDRQATRVEGVKETVLPEKKV